MNPFLKTEISQLAGILLICGSIGNLLGQLRIALLLGMLLFFIKHGLYLIKLAYLVLRRQQIPYPYPLGIWGLIYREIDRQRSRSRKRKRTLNRFTSRFRKVASLIPDAYILLDKSARVEWANQAARLLLHVNWPRDEGVPLTDIVAYPDLDDYLEAADFSRPLEFPSPVNKAVILSLRITPFGGKRAQRLVVIRNITDLFHLNQVRRDFVSNVSHELRTPLTVITGFLENLSENNPQPFQQRPFTLMLQQSQRMNTIISDLLTLSKLEMGEKPSNHKPVAVPALIRKIIDQAQPLAEQKGGYTIVDEVDEDLWIVGNESELESAFSNLVFNAIIHTPPKTRIGISWGLQADAVHRSVKGESAVLGRTNIAADTTALAHPEGSALGVQELEQPIEQLPRIHPKGTSSGAPEATLQHSSINFSVSDSGPGIPDRHIPRLTERFYRIDKGRSRQSGGTGLGLAIVKHVISRHEGELIISSKEGFGSQFTCAFPEDMALERMDDYPET